MRYRSRRVTQEPAGRQPDRLFRTGSGGGARLARHAGETETGARPAGGECRRAASISPKISAFLDWLADNHFTFLGARDYRLLAADGKDNGEHGCSYRRSPKAGSWACCSTPMPGLIQQGRRAARPQRRGARLSRRVRTRRLLIVTKPISAQLCRIAAPIWIISGSRSSAPTGAFIGEHRFVGLFTSSAYSLSPRAIPLLRKKIAMVMSALPGLPCRPAMTARRWRISSTAFPATKNCSRFPQDGIVRKTAMGILQLGGRAQGQAVPAFRPLRPVCFGAAVRAARSCHRRSAANASMPSWPAPSTAGPLPPRRRSTTARWCASTISSVATEGVPCAKVDVRALEHEIEIGDQDLGRRSVPRCAVAPRHGRAEGVIALRERRAARVHRGLSRHSSPPRRRRSDSGGAGANCRSIMRRLWSRIRAHVYRQDGDAHSALRIKFYVLGEVLPLSVSLPIFGKFSA